MKRSMAIRLSVALACSMLTACGNLSLDGPPAPVSTPEAVPPTPPAEDPVIRELRSRIEKLSAHLVEVNRRNAQLTEESRRTEAALREAQKKAEELQQKLDALRAIDKDTRTKRKP